MRRVTFIALLLLILIGCIGSEIQVYVKPDYDFSVYRRIAVLPATIIETEGMDRTLLSENIRQISALLSVVAAEKGFPVIHVDEVTRLLKEGKVAVDAERSTDWLIKAASACKADSLLTAEVNYYGTFTYRVPPSYYPLYYHSYWYGYRYYHYPPYYIEPGYLETGSRVAMKLLFYDGATGSIVWWAEGEESGSRVAPHYYAKRLIKRLLKKFPVKPPKAKKD